MEHKFYPSLFARLIFLLLSIGAAFIFIIMCFLTLYDMGMQFAADSFEFFHLLILMVTISICLVTGICAWHFMRLAISPFPSLKFDDDWLYYRSTGSVGYEKVSWKGLRFARQKGILKHVYMTVIVLQNVELNQKQNVFYRAVKSLLRIVYRIIRFNFSPAKNNNTFRIYRISIGVPFGNITSIMDEKIDRAFLVKENNPHLQDSRQEPVIERWKPVQFPPVLGRLFSRASIWLVVLFPFAITCLGAATYFDDMQHDPTTRQTHLLREKAVSGDADAQNKFGWRLSNGIGVPQSSSRANVWYRKAAKQGHAKAQYNVARIYLIKKKPKRRDRKEAAKWLRKSANQGFSLAQSRLGYLYYTGRGVKKSYANAYSLFNKAAAQEDELAYYYLGKMHENGDGLPQSNDIALRYYKDALQRGYSNAAQAIKRLSESED